MPLIYPQGMDRKGKVTFMTMSKFLKTQENKARGKKSVRVYENKLEAVVYKLLSDEIQPQIKLCIFTLVNVLK